MGPQTRAADVTHAMKYREPGEMFRDTANRVAAALADDSEHYHVFREILGDMRFLPAGRIQAAVGSSKSVTAYNCFVSGTIADSYVDGDGSIMQRAADAAATMRMGGGIGYDFSTLRPKGALIKRLQSHSTGPLSFMRIFDAVCRCTASSGHRRGAQMGVLRVDHPDIFEFVNAKHDQETLSGFNISVAVTDEFMEAVDKGSGFALRFGGETYRTINAQALWESIMRSTWDWAEPGVLFIDTINRMNNLAYCETIAATNPCAEQPLPPFGACLLGSFNLTRYISRQPVTVEDIRDGKPGSGFAFQWDQFTADIAPVVRAMDNIVDRALYPLPQQAEEAKSKRRMGLGVTGLANAGEALGMPYGSSAFVEFAERVCRLLARGAYRVSTEIADEKGAFPLFDAERYLASPFVQSLEEDVRDAIRTHGIRNSHLTSIAPTGTISMCADNISSGVEPVFSWASRRPINTPDGAVEMDLVDYGVKFLGVKGRRTADVSLDEHLAVLIAASRQVDSAVSKTINCDGKTPWETFKTTYRRAWEGGAKGCSTFNTDGKRFGLLASADDIPQAPYVVDTSCTFDAATGQRECA